MLGNLEHLDLREPDVQSRINLAIPGLMHVVPPAPPQPQALKASNFKGLLLILRKLHAMDETNPEGGDDDMILGGIRVGASGNVAVIPGFFAGNFDDGDVQNFGALPLGRYSLLSTPGYPKCFYAIFTLVESDSDDQEVADTLTTALNVVAKVAGTWNAAVGIVVAAIGTLLSVILGGVIDEDWFPPYGIELCLTGPNQWGPAGKSKNLLTPGISGHGGTYRIGYRWQLVA